MLLPFDWTFNGVKPFKIISMDATSFPKITLHCAANYTDTRYTMPIDEIEAFKAISCHSITNEPTMSGGTDLQASIDGSIIPISNGEENWLGALYYPSHNPDDVAETLIKFDLIFELQIVNKEIIPEDPDDPDTTRPYNLITNGFSYTVPTTGTAKQLLGTFTFNWDAIGTVYIMSDWLAEIATDLVDVDDKLVVTNGDGASITQNYNAGGHYVPGPPMNITSLLVEGDNQITFEVQDIYGYGIGCGRLFMVQIV